MKKLSQKQLKDLPPELLAQLRCIEKPTKSVLDKTSNQGIVLNIIKKNPEGLCADEIILFFYMKHKKIMKRHSVQQVLYTLNRKGLVHREDNTCFFKKGE